MWKNLIILGLTIILIWIVVSPSKEINTNTKKIDSLEYVISTLENKRDSLAIERDTIKIEIEKVITKYEKIHNTIINNSPDSDYIFFSNYLDWYRTTKGN